MKAAFAKFDDGGRSVVKQGDWMAAFEGDYFYRAFRLGDGSEPEAVFVVVFVPDSAEIETSYVEIGGERHFDRLPPASASPGRQSEPASVRVLREGA
jgi:hypothetical protein